MNFSNLTIILVNTQLAENIGLASRAMFNFGISNLRLVKPKIEWPSEKANAVSVDAKTIVEQAAVYNDLRYALEDIDYSVAFTARRRDMNKSFISNEQLIEDVSSKASNQKIGIVFGGESSGLSNEHISLVSKCVTIDTHDNFSSLNLSHAVAVFCYSLFQAQEKRREPEERDLALEVKNSELLNFFELSYPLS